MAAGGDENPYSPPSDPSPTNRVASAPETAARRRSRTAPEHQPVIKSCIFLFLLAAVLLALSVSVIPLLLFR